MMKLQIINGPNINLLGKREPLRGSFESCLTRLKRLYPDIQSGKFPVKKNRRRNN